MADEQTRDEDGQFEEKSGGEVEEESRPLVGPVPAAALEDAPEPRIEPGDTDTPRAVIRQFLDGQMPFPAALDELAGALADRYDLPYIPGALEDRLLRALADVVLTLLEEISR